MNSWICGYVHSDLVKFVGITACLIYVVPPLTKGNWTIGFSAVPWPSVYYSLIISFRSKQMKGLESISSVAFAFVICCCQLKLWNLKCCHCQWSKAFVRLKNQNKPIQEIAKILGAAESNIYTDKLRNTRKNMKTTVVNDRRILSLVKKIASTEK